MSDTQKFKVNDRVYKDGGDYIFQGIVVCAFQKRNGKWRYVVENIDGVLHIFSGKQLAMVPENRRASV